VSSRIDSAESKVGTKAQLTHGAILEAAEVVFSEKGYAAARLEDIAERVGIRRASLVYYYKNKAALYGAVLDRVLGDLHARYEQVLRRSVPLPERLHQLVDEWAQYAEERPSLLRILLREMADGLTPHSRSLAERMAPLFQSVGGAIAEAQRAGAVEQIHPMHLMMIIAGSSAFLLLARPLVAATSASALLDTERDQHRAVVRMLARELLGPPSAGDQR